ncbi:MAG: phosphoribosylformylglycinamidine synthase subunit PurL, partial [Saprospiraceae bacterium]|nr:phosphoribosylformylglycinamidine synthase subunit PurL [Saprospiraceae bacterium]
MTTSAEPQVTVQTALSLGITEDEFRTIVDIMGRTPNFNEISIFSVMWSEHCSYKNSILWLKTLPRDGGRLLTGAGEENVGLVDLGEGLACAFKIESHNQASAIEPCRGAATGIAGKVYFNDCYNQNILLFNAMSVGIVKVGETVSAAAGEPGNLVFIVGSATGKDGIHGAAFASANLTENSTEYLPSVQADDPFQENFLLEAIKTGAIAGMQDMGAAGITCAAAEMCARSEEGMRIDLDKAPIRRQGMKAWEILLPESQEGMLIAAKKGMEHLLLEVFEKWDIECSQIGEVIEGGSLEYYQHGEKVADVPTHALVRGGGAPVYKRDYRRPSYMDKIVEFRPNKLATPTDWPATARQLMTSPNVVSKRWIHEQYDSMARPGTLSTNSDSDAAVVRIPGSPKALAMTANYNAAYVYADPYVGAMIAVAEAARNIICAGGEPAAITNCLHFGNPNNPEAYYQFVHAIKGMGEACRKFGTPVTGSNVSFYNQSEFQDRTEPVYPRPIIGMVGILDDATKQMTFSFKSAGDHIYMVGSPSNDINSS